MNSETTKTTILCAFVKTPDGTQVLCEVKEIIPSFFSLLPQIAVKAISGAPFNGQRIAVVEMQQVNLTTSQKGIIR